MVKKSWWCNARHRLAGKGVLRPPAWAKEQISADCFKPTFCDCKEKVLDNFTDNFEGEENGYFFGWRALRDGTRWNTKWDAQNFGAFREMNVNFPI